MRREISKEPIGPKNTDIERSQQLIEQLGEKNKSYHLLSRIDTEDKQLVPEEKIDFKIQSSKGWSEDLSRALYDKSFQKLRASQKNMVLNLELIMAHHGIALGHMRPGDQWHFDFKQTPPTFIFTPERGNPFSGTLTLPERESAQREAIQTLGTLRTTAEAQNIARGRLNPIDPTVLKVLIQNENLSELFRAMGQKDLVDLKGRQAFLQSTDWEAASTRQNINRQLIAQLGRKNAKPHLIDETTGKGYRGTSEQNRAWVSSIKDLLYKPVAASPAVRAYEPLPDLEFSSVYPEESDFETSLVSAHCEHLNYPKELGADVEIKAESAFRAYLIAYARWKGVEIDRDSLQIKWDQFSDLPGGDRRLTFIWKQRKPGGDFYEQRMAAGRPQDLHKVIRGIEPIVIPSTATFEEISEPEVAPPTSEIAPNQATIELPYPRGNFVDRLQSHPSPDLTKIDLPSEESVAAYERYQAVLESADVYHLGLPDNSPLSTEQIDRMAIDFLKARIFEKGVKISPNTIEIEFDVLENGKVQGVLRWQESKQDENQFKLKTHPMGEMEIPTESSKSDEDALDAKIDELQLDSATIESIDFRDDLLAAAFRKNAEEEARDYLKERQKATGVEIDPKGITMEWAISRGKAKYLLKWNEKDSNDSAFRSEQHWSTEIWWDSPQGAEISDSEVVEPSNQTSMKNLKETSLPLISESAAFTHSSPLPLDVRGEESIFESRFRELLNDRIRKTNVEIDPQTLSVKWLFLPDGTSGPLLKWNERHAGEAEFKFQQEWLGRPKYASQIAEIERSADFLVGQKESVPQSLKNLSIRKFNEPDDPELVEAIENRSKELLEDRIRQEKVEINPDSMLIVWLTNSIGAPQCTLLWEEKNPGETSFHSEELFLGPGHQETSESQVASSLDHAANQQVNYPEHLNKELQGYLEMFARISLKSREQKESVRVDPNSIKMEWYEEKGKWKHDLVWKEQKIGEHQAALVEKRKKMHRIEKA